VPGSQYQQGASVTIESNLNSIARYIKAIYNYGLGIVGILAAIMMMIGGIIWLTAEGSPEKISQAKSFIGSSLIGLFLLLTAYMLFQPLIRIWLIIN